MKKMLLKRMMLISMKEKAAKIIDFHPKITLITGQNDTGKSSVIKSIYETFGAEITNTTNWDKLDVFNFIEFSLESEDYYILYSHKPRWFYIKSKNGEKSRYFESITSELSPWLCDLIDFKLELTNKNEQRQRALPAFIFMPFYIDQDKGWVQTFNSFERMAFFSSWKNDLLDYYVGKKPPEYFPIKTKKINLENIFQEKDQKYSAEKVTLASFIENFKAPEIEINVDAFKNEISNFEQKILNLNERRRQSKENILKINNRLRIIDEQINIATSLSKELELDYDFAAKIEQADHIECPTCGAEYDNKLINRFTLIDDHHKSLNIIGDLIEERDELKSDRNLLENEIQKIIFDIQVIENILSEKKGQLSFNEYVDGRAKRTVLVKFDEKVSQNNDDLEIDKEMISEHEQLLKEMTNIKLSKEINEKYRKYLQNAFMELDIRNVNDSVYKRLDASINISGSDQPRAILGYYYAILRLINENPSVSLLPLIIDSPKQQDQDTANEKIIFEFIRKKLSFINQLILGSVDIPELEKFDEHYHYHFEKKLKVLNSSDYEYVSSVVSPMISEALEGKTVSFLQ